MAVVTNPDENLTGGQIQDIMDTLLEAVLRPMLVNSTIFDTQLVFALSFIAKNKKRKISTAGRYESINYLTKALLAADVEEKIFYVQKAKLERSMIHLFVKKLLESHYQSFMSMYGTFLTSRESHPLIKRKLDLTARNLGCKKRSNIFVMLNSCAEGLKVYNKYVDSIVAQYLKLCSQQAKFFVDTNPHNQYSIKDVRQNFLTNILVALNKYDSSKGALTSYINFWLLNAQTCASGTHEYGIAYTVPPQYRRKLATDKESGLDINFSISLDAQVEDDDGEQVDLHNKLESTDNVDRQLEQHKMGVLFSMLAKNADPFGIGRLTLEVDEHFTQSELDLMQAHMHKQKL